MGHSGAFFLGAATSVYLIPEEHLGILALTNALPVGLPESICLTFLDLVHFGKPQRNYLPLVGQVMSQMISEFENASTNYAALAPPKDPLPARVLGSYAGKYTNEYFGSVEFAEEGGRLILRLPPRGAYYELTHWDGDTFTYYLASENTGTGRRGANFLLDKNHVLTESLCPEHDAVFTRTPD